MSKSSKLSYAIGDVVRYKHPNPREYKPTGNLLVEEATIDEERNLSYMVDGFGWVDHDELVFVSHATTATIKQVARNLLEGEEDYDPLDDDD